MKYITVLMLALALTILPCEAGGKKKNQKKYEKKEVVTDAEHVVNDSPQPVSITDPERQIYGEWTIISLRQKKISTQERPYIYLDFKAKKVYGSNGCNSINGDFVCNKDKIAFNDFIAGNNTCHSTTSERTIMKALGEVKSYKLIQHYGMLYIELLNAKGGNIMTLRRQNLDLISGAWSVKELNGEIVIDKNARLVIDPDQLTIHGQTGCNVINGIITVDPEKEMAVQFEDLHSGINHCETIGLETALLIALEQAESCKRINDNETALLDGAGKIIIVLKRLQLKK